MENIKLGYLKGIKSIYLTSSAIGALIVAYATGLLIFYPEYYLFSLCLVAALIPIGALAYYAWRKELILAEKIFALKNSLTGIIQESNTQQSPTVR